MTGAIHPPNDYITVKQFADRIGVSAMSVYRAIHDGKIEAKNLNPNSARGRYIIHVSELVPILGEPLPIWPTEMNDA